MGIVLDFRKGEWYIESVTNRFQINSVQTADDLIFSQNAQLRAIKALREKTHCIDKDNTNDNHVHDLESKKTKLNELRMFVKERLRTANAKGYTAKLGEKFTGPYCVKKQLGIIVYELVDNNDLSVGNWHVKDLKPHQDPHN
ncbi:hypothetical protein ILUMI_13942 [Ignelater luminosus]|uniref:Uncharacterized protein n=1 Tax=Ignelater luminosus TaxID=2038154 RepID=A0A8K0CWV1_IGNLU|nr:hypothetical protein ILUMI_13942 [Ignelater luminosus]